MGNLIVLTYPDQETGQKVFAELDNLQKQQLLMLIHIVVHNKHWRVQK